jgi:signal transduction histidine kinase
MSSSADSPPFEEIQTDERYELFGKFAKMRLVNGLPWAAAFFVFAFTQTPLWRQVLLFTLTFMVFAVTAWDVVLFTRRRAARLSKVPLPRFVIAPGLGFVVTVFATGALESPLLIGGPMISFMAAYFAPRWLARLMVMGVQLPVIGLMALISVLELVPDLMPPIFGGGANAGHPAVLLWTTAVVTCLVMLGTYWLGGFLRASYQSVLERAASDRDRTLAMHAEQSEALTTLSGEIAHELKNPLASVKGLAALMSSELKGETAEQMTVLRREVDRMQTILEDFLNFSRPLVPLTQQPVELANLGREVALLHHGMAAAKDISVGIQAPDRLEANCDDRKIRQILINLLQNALEASPKGSRVAIEVVSDGGDVVIRVLDRGPGLAEELRNSFFEPGVTDKPKGSGLGLTVARALARQHGGELALANREDGGCVAELRIPRDPPSGEVAS